LTRVKALYSQAGKPPPLLLINFLWGLRAGRKFANSSQTSVDRKPLQYTGALIDSYRDLGWEIAVVNVGASVNATILKSDPRLLWDDDHHPSCKGANLIADMLHYVFTSNSTRCDHFAVNSNAMDSSASLRKATTWNLQSQTQSLVPLHKDVLGIIDPSWNDLWTDLFQESARIGSLTPREPRVENVTLLQVAHYPDKIWNLPKRIIAKTYPSREDRKYAYIIPSCTNTDTPQEPTHLDLTLREPDLKWLGMGLLDDEGRYFEKNDHFDIQIRINNILIKVAPSRKWNSSGVFILWIHLMKQQVPRANTYRITLCTQQQSRQQQRAMTAYLEYLIGVSIPSNNNK